MKIKKTIQNFVPAIQQSNDTSKINPIFIVGAPRSGTSLLRVMLNRHPAIGICDETYYFYYVYNRQKAFGDLAELAARRRLITQYLQTFRIQRLNLDMQALSKALMSEGTDYASFFLTLIRFYAVSQGKQRYGEKTPQNALYASLICDIYPSCKLIHIVRDPRDVVASLMWMPWSSNSVLANARTWINCNRSANQCRQRSNYLLVFYERLVNDPEAELSRICNFLGEGYTPAMLESNSPAKTDRWWFQRSQRPLTKDRVETWKKKLDFKQVALIEWLVKPYMNMYGYGTSGFETSFRDKALATMDEIRDTVLQRVKKLPRMWYYWVTPTHLAQEEVWNDRNV